ncbi:MAG: SDR family NAD(P)-dependent oxidoreductase [Chloroflexota bacterium]
MQADLRDKVALVTGSTYGIGKAVALKLASNGADIVVNARTEGSGTEVVAEIKKLGRRAIFEKADITMWPEVQRMATGAVFSMGKVDILVVSGGAAAEMGMPNFFRNMHPDEYLSFIKAQYLSRLYCVKALLDHMIERKSGNIVLITTDAGRFPTPAECLPGGAGAGVVMATKVLAKELGRWQVRVNAISTTVTRDTPGLETVLKGSAGHVFQQGLEKQLFPLYSKHIAEAVLFFASDDSSAITGQTLSVNGGLCFPG